MSRDVSDPYSYINHRCIHILSFYMLYYLYTLKLLIDLLQKSHVWLCTLRLFYEDPQ